MTLDIATHCVTAHWLPIARDFNSHADLEADNKKAARLTSVSEAGRKNAL